MAAPLDSMTSFGSSNELLESILAHALELRDQGHPDWLNVATQECPEYRAAVLDAVGGTDLMAGMFNEPAPNSAAGLVLGGRFRLGKRIGAGAMGMVHLAEDLKLIRPVAVKILRGGLMDKTQSMRRFLREAEAMASVQHPSVVTIHDQGQTAEDEPYIVMEYLEGAPLSTIVDEAAFRQSEGLPVDTAWLLREFGIQARGENSLVRVVVTWIADLAAGLAVVHAAGVLHRDIKPSNVIICKDGRPVLLDFGLALLDGDSSLTRGVTSVGTPSYMPPEALVRNQDRGPHSDVYSLTATLYHLLTLQPPYQGTPSEVLAAIATNEPQPASQLRPGLPRDLGAILDKGMHRKPRGRYTDVHALEADLRAFLDYRPVVARPVSGLQRLVRKTLRSTMARGAALALALVALVGVGYQAKQLDDQRQAARAFTVQQALPPAFSILGKANRNFRYDADREALAEVLDTGVELERSPVTLPLLRASFRLDNGDPLGAAQDMQRVAEAVDTPYARALAASYQSAPADAHTSDAIALDALPAPITAMDRYLAGYHLMRAGQFAAGHELLSTDEVRAIPHAEELRIASLSLKGLEAPVRFARSLEAKNDLLALEARLGGRTAATAQLMGVYLIQLQLYRDAVDVLEQGVRLAPRSYTLRINAGYTAFKIGALDKAREHLEVAMDMRPNYIKPLHNFVWTLIGQGAYDEALARLASAPLDATQDNEHQRLLHQFYVEVYRALNQKNQGQTEAFQASLERASVYLASAKAIQKVAPDAATVIYDGMRSDNTEAVFIGLCALYQQDPGDTWILKALLETMPTDLSAEATALVHNVLLSFYSPQLQAE